MKKIGLVICYFHENYGSMLQAYATQKVIDDMGLENEAIYCENPHMYMSMSKIEYYYRKLTNRDILIDKIKRSRGKWISPFVQRELKKNKVIRSRKFQEFKKHNFTISRKYRNREELIADTREHLLYLVGSDQLWSPANIDNDFYTLTFVPDEIPKISYATSFGTTVLPNYQKKRTKAFLERFDYLSVREKSGKQLVETLSSKKAEVVLDPTLLLEREEWDRIALKESIVKGNYIFCYFLGNNQAHRQFARELKEKTGFQIVALQHMDQYVPKDRSFADVVPYEVGPGEFVTLIKNAAYICTDSFHGTVFSIIYGKKFFTFNRFQKSGITSTNTRIDSLLESLGLDDRRKQGKENIEECMQENIEYDMVYKKLRELRRKSISYMEKALGSVIDMNA